MAGFFNKGGGGRGVDPSANHVMTDYYTKASGSDNNMQTDSYINNESTDNTIPPPSIENSQKDQKIIRHRTFQHQRHLSIRKTCTRR